MYSKTRKEAVLIVEMDGHYCEAFHMFAVGHPKPPNCKFAARYEYALMDVVVYLRSGVAMDFAQTRQIADHYYSQFVSVQHDSTYVNRHYFS